MRRLGRGSARGGEPCGGLAFFDPGQIPNGGRECLRFWFVSCSRPRVAHRCRGGLDVEGCDAPSRHPLRRRARLCLRHARRARRGARLGVRHRQDHLRVHLRRLRCAVGHHQYRYEGVMLGNRIERCRRCNKVRLAPAAKLGTVHALPPFPGARARLSDTPNHGRTDRRRRRRNATRANCDSVRDFAAGAAGEVPVCTAAR